MLTFFNRYLFIVKGSLFLGFLKKLINNNRYLENDLIVRCFKNSHLFKLSKNIWEFWANSYKFCYWARVLFQLKEIKPFLLKNSFILKGIYCGYIALEKRLSNYSKSSKILNFNTIQNDIFSFSSIFIIILIATATNIILSFSLNCVWSLMGWIIRGTFLLIGLYGIIDGSTMERVYKKGLKIISKILFRNS